MGYKGALLLHATGLYCCRGALLLHEQLQASTAARYRPLLLQGSSTAARAATGLYCCTLQASRAGDTLHLCRLHAAPVHAAPVQSRLPLLLFGRVEPLSPHAPRSICQAGKTRRHTHRRGPPAPGRQGGNQRLSGLFTLLLLQGADSLSLRAAIRGQAAYARCSCSMRHPPKRPATASTSPRPRSSTLRSFTVPPLGCNRRGDSEEVGTVGLRGRGLGGRRVGGGRRGLGGRRV